jgi:hypothetical protein
VALRAAREALVGRRLIALRRVFRIGWNSLDWYYRHPAIRRVAHLERTWDGRRDCEEVDGPKERAKVVGDFRLGLGRASVGGEEELMDQRVLAGLGRAKRTGSLAESPSCSATRNGSPPTTTCPRARTMSDASWTSVQTDNDSQARCALREGCTWPGIHSRVSPAWARAVIAHAFRRALARMRGETPHALPPPSGIRGLMPRPTLSDPRAA